MAAQRIDLMFGGVSVEVSLAHTSGKPAEAKHDTRRMIGDLPADEAREKALAEHAKRHTFEVTDAPGPALAAYVGEHGPVTIEMKTESDRPIPAAVSERQLAAYEELMAPLDPYADLPEERVEQGVQLDDGEFLDLTDRLAEIDERTRIDGMEVVATIDATSVPRHRVRDSYWVGLAPGAQGTPKVLALLWVGLRKQRRAAVVKWTKRTNQALGIIVAAGTVVGSNAMRGDGPALVLLELEWSANMRKPDAARVQVPLMATTSIREEAAALALVEALAEPPAFLDSVRDERTAKRAELLQAARAGELEAFVPPPEPVVAESDLADVLAGAS